MADSQNAAPELPPQLPPHPLLAKPAHGNGLLLRGSLPGHPGAGGRPPSAVRAAWRESADKRRPILEKIADGEIEAAPSERIKAVDVLAKHGFASDGPQGVVGATGELTAEGFRFSLVLGERLGATDE